MDIFQENNVSFKLNDEEIESFCKLINGVYENSTLKSGIGFSVKNKIRLDEDVELLVADFAMRLGIIEIEEEN